MPRDRCQIGVHEPVCSSASDRGLRSGFLFSLTPRALRSSWTKIFASSPYPNLASSCSAVLSFFSPWSIFVSACETAVVDITTKAISRHTRRISNCPNIVVVSVGQMNPAEIQARGFHSKLKYHRPCFTFARCPLFEVFAQGTNATAQRTTPEKGI